MSDGNAGIAATAFSAGLTFFAAIAAFAAAVVVLYWALPMLRDARATLNEHLPVTRRKLSVPFIVIVAILFAFAVLASLFVLIHTMHLVWAGSTNGINLGSGTLIAALLGAPFLIWGTWLKYQTVRYQKEGHITDRINKAVEQLGAEKTVKVPGKDKDGKDITIEETRPNIEVRIGAILSLERIAQDSTMHDKGRDHVRVMEILCAYVRENSRARKPEDFPEPEWEPLLDDATDEMRAAQAKARTTRFGRYHLQAKARTWAQTLASPRLDVAQALKVIGRRTAGQRRVEAAWPEVPDDRTVWPFELPCPHLPDQISEAPLTWTELETFKERLKEWQDAVYNYRGYRLDLTGANLQGAELSPRRPDSSDAVFSGMLLPGARLEGADLSKSRLEGIDFTGAHLEGTDLSMASLQAADLSSVRLEGANFLRARLQGTFLTEARMNGANMNGARLEGADLVEAHMECANLSRARLEGADLWGARLVGADLSGGHLDGADLTRVRADATTKWKNALLSQTSVQLVDLSTASISAVQLKASFGDGSTRIPKEMTRPRHWPVAELKGRAFNEEWAKWRADPAGYVPPPPPSGQ